MANFIFLNNGSRLNINKLREYQPRYFDGSFNIMLHFESGFSYSICFETEEDRDKEIKRLDDFVKVGD